MAVGDVVEGAARAPHDDAPSANSAISAGSGQRGAASANPPPAGKQQEPGSDRPVEASEPRIGPGMRRQLTFDPIAAIDVAGVKIGGRRPLTRLAALGPLSGIAGEGGPGPQSLPRT